MSNEYRFPTNIKRDADGSGCFPFESTDKYSDFTVLINGEPCLVYYRCFNTYAILDCYLQSPTSQNSDPFVELRIDYLKFLDQYDGDTVHAEYLVTVTEWWDDDESHEIAIYYNKRKSVSTEDIWVYAHNVEDPSYYDEWVNLTRMLNFLSQAISQGILQDYQFYAHGYMPDPEPAPNDSPLD